MKRFVFVSLIFLSLFLVLTYKGFVFSQMAEPMDLLTIECVTHCISAATPTPFTTTAVIMTSFIVFVLIAFRRQEVFSAMQPSRQKWRDTIQRFLLRQQLATIVLQD